MTARICGVIAFILLLLFSISWAEEASLTATDMKVTPDTVSPGQKVLISCRVSHTSGAKYIERVSATVFHGKWVTQYPMLYDDGTHGDRVAEDGVYLLEMNAPDTQGEVKILFQAVDTDRNEVEFSPVFLKVQ